MYLYLNESVNRRHHGHDVLKQLLRYLYFLTRSRCDCRAFTSFGCLSPSLLTSLTNALLPDKTTSIDTCQYHITISDHCPVLQEYVSLQVNYIVYVRACVRACLPVDVYACTCAHACVYAIVPPRTIFFLIYVSTVQCTVMLNKPIHKTCRCPDPSIGRQLV